MVSASPRITSFRRKQIVFQSMDDELRQLIDEFRDELKSLKHRRKLAYKQEEVEEMFGVTGQTIRNWRNKGLIGYSKIGGTVLFSVQDIEHFLKSNHSDAFACVKD